MARNRFDIDEKLESEFSFEHLKRSMVYIQIGRASCRERVSSPV